MNLYQVRKHFNYWYTLHILAHMLNVVVDKILQISLSFATRLTPTQTTPFWSWMCGLNYCLLVNQINNPGISGVEILKDMTLFSFLKKMHLSKNMVRMAWPQDHERS